ncbi:hypothetical protein LPB86_16840 [Pedobacter sp. MC2016-14]|uniref:hypothetical protein n=1 Tax=Pedobacter sp. MC2016-14 TaxID=2897327 RepID=UPI001E5A9F01|nr:hypothetical protein [Pedobacter sp. MC2016-14]MCD0489911.1 hypothetical protein [Pedobacter sp. MC2016-14]
MKAIKLLILPTTFLFLLACGGKANKTNDNSKKWFINAYKDESLEELRSTFKSQAEDIDRLLTLINLKMEISPSTTFDQSSNEGVVKLDSYPLASEKKIEEEMSKLAANYKFIQMVDENGAQYQTALPEDFKKPPIFGEGIDDKYKTVLSSRIDLNKIFLHDKSSLDKKQIMQTDLDEPARTKSVKLADSVNAQLNYEYVTKTRKVVLDKDHLETKIGNTPVTLKQLGNRSATLLFKGPSDRILLVLGMDKTGRLIETNSTSSNSAPSAAKQKLLKEYSQLLNKAVSNLDKGKYGTTQDLLNDLADQLPNGLSDEENKEVNSMLSSYHFYNDVEKVVVYVADEIRSGKINVTIKNEDVIASGVSIAKGDKKDLFGIIGANGKWLLTPQFKNLQAINSYYYKACNNKENSMDCSYYRLDIKNKKMISFSETALKTFAISATADATHVSVYKADKNDEYANVGADKGILDKDGKFVIEPLYIHVNISGKYIYAIRDVPGGHNTITLFDLKGSVVIPPTEDGFTIKQGIVFSKLMTKGGNEAPIYKTLDTNTGQSFLPAGDYSLYNDFDKDNFILVKSKNTKYYLSRDKVKKAYKGI